MRRILVTGATGFVGKALLEVMSAEGRMEIRALARRPEKLSCPTVEVIKGNLLSPPSLLEASTGCDTVLHMAAYRRTSFFPPHKSELSYNVNVVGTRNILMASVKQGVRYFIYTSSHLAEHAQTDYARNKRLAEKLVAEICEENELNHYILRIGSILDKSRRLFALRILDSFKAPQIDYLLEHFAKRKMAAAKLADVVETMHWLIANIERVQPGLYSLISETPNIEEIVERVSGRRRPRHNMARIYSLYERLAAKVGHRTFVEGFRLNSYNKSELQSLAKLKALNETIKEEEETYRLR